MLLIVDAGVCRWDKRVDGQNLCNSFEGSVWKPASGETSGGAEGFFCLML